LDRDIGTSLTDFIKRVSPKRTARVQWSDDTASGDPQQLLNVEDVDLDKRPILVRGICRQAP